MAARKSNERFSATVDVDAGRLIITLVDAEGATLKNAVDVRVAEIPAELHTALLLHGLKQKIADAAAIPRDEQGRSASWGEKISAMRVVAEALKSGEWSTRGEGTGTPAGLLFTALSRLYPALSAEDIRAKLAGMDKATQAKMRKAPKVAAMIETIKAERAANGEPEVGDDDIDGMFADLNQ